MRRNIAGLLSTALALVCLSTLHGQDECAPVEDFLVAGGLCESKQINDCAVCEPVDSELLCPGLYVRGEYLQLRVRRRGLDFAIATDGTALGTGAGTVRNVDFSHDPGFRISLGYVTTTGWEVGVRFTGLSSDATARAAAPLNGNLWATRSHPARNQEATAAVASAAFDYQLYDMEAGRWFTLNDVTAFRCFAGLSWIDSDQRLRVNYDGNDFNDSVFVDRQRDTGFGIRVGGEGHWDVNCRSSVFARIDGRVMFTHTDMQLLETNNAGADVIVDLADRFTAPVANLGAAVGIAYYVGSWELRGGYELTNWFNLGNRTGFDDAHVGAYDPVSSDILLDGFFLSASWTY